jgi:hypothetical protein
MVLTAGGPPCVGLQAGPPEPEPEPEPEWEPEKLGRTTTGSIKIAPLNGNEPRIYLAKAEYDYAGEGDDLAFAEGALIEVISDFIEDLGEGWSMGRLGGQPSSFGFFPAAYAVRPSPDPLPRQSAWAGLSAMAHAARLQHSGWLLNELGDGAGAVGGGGGGTCRGKVRWSHQHGAGAGAPS